MPDSAGDRLSDSKGFYIEVLGFSAQETAESLDTTTASVNSALQRARKTVDERLPDQHVRRRELAEEILHDAFLQIWNKAGTYNPALGSARGWIYTVVRHCALNALRSLSASPERDDEHYEELIEAHAAWHSNDQSAEQHALAQCLERLEEQRRQAVLLAFVDGYSHEQVAAQLGSPLGTVKSWIRRGLVALKECLS